MNKAIDPIGSQRIDRLVDDDCVTNGLRAEIMHTYFVVGLA